MYIEYIDCHARTMIQHDDVTLSHRFESLPFCVQKITLSPTNTYAQKIINQAKLRLSSMNMNVVDSSGKVRSPREQQLKSLCGLIVEQLCFAMLNCYNPHPNQIQIVLDDSNSPIDQIDLTILKHWQDHTGQTKHTKRSVEIRSSFSFKPIHQAVSWDFDILGAYHNNVKLSEVYKDFYLRYVFCLDYPTSHIIKNQHGKINYNQTTSHVLDTLYFDDKLNLQRDMVVYFVGGATLAMMQDDSIAYDGSMRSDDFNTQNTAHYRKLKIKNALDSLSILKMMLSVITSECQTGK